jgi:hypothetical protein
MMAATFVFEEKEMRALLEAQQSVRENKTIRAAKNEKHQMAQQQRITNAQKTDGWLIRPYSFSNQF